MSRSRRVSKPGKQASLGADRPKYKSSKRTRPGYTVRKDTSHRKYVFVKFIPEHVFVSSKSFTGFDEAVAYAKTRIRADKTVKAAEISGYQGGARKVVKVDRKTAYEQP